VTAPPAPPVGCIRRIGVTRSSPPGEVSGDDPAHLPDPSSLLGTGVRRSASARVRKSRRTFRGRRRESAANLADGLSCHPRSRPTVSRLLEKRRPSVGAVARSGDLATTVETSPQRWGRGEVRRPRHRRVRFVLFRVANGTVRRRGHHAAASKVVSSASRPPSRENGRSRPAKETGLPDHRHKRLTSIGLRMAS
jgi:hypothetical protein